MIRVWLKLVVKMDSIERTIKIINEPDNLDKVLLKREIESPRE
jgi:hypothetical protein